MQCQICGAKLEKLDRFALQLEQIQDKGKEEIGQT